VLAGGSGEVKYRDMNRSSTGRVIVVITVALAALLGAFLLGRASAPDASATSGPDCSRAARFGINVPAQFRSGQEMAFYTRCEEQAATGKFGEPASRVKIYASQTGTKVVAWWYPDCGMPEGVFAVGTPHPPKCAEVGTTASGAQP